MGLATGNVCERQHVLSQLADLGELDGCRGERAERERESVCVYVCVVSVSASE